MSDLYQVTFKVRPAKEHPQFWRWQFGWLNVFLFAAGEYDAIERAKTITDQLPYEAVELTGMVQQLNGTAVKPHFRQAEQDARHSGLGFHLIGYVPGADEEDFEAFCPS
ncbi:MAG: hypothetical protein ACJ8M1_05255 [Chthoniobacterales bacterium]